MPADASRERLLDAAERVFGEDGFDKASIRAIAKKARANSALIQYHFGGKAGLYEAVIERRLSAARQLFDRATSLVDSAAKVKLTREVAVVAIRTLLLDFVRMAESAPWFDRLMRREESAGFPFAGKVMSRITPLEPLAKFFERAQKDGIVRRDVPAWFIAMNVFAMHRHCVAHAPILRNVFGKTLPPTDELVGMTSSLALDGLWTEKKK